MLPPYIPWSDHLTIPTETAIIPNCLPYGSKPKRAPKPQDSFETSAHHGVSPRNPGGYPRAEVKHVIPGHCAIVGTSPSKRRNSDVSISMDSHVRMQQNHVVHPFLSVQPRRKPLLNGGYFYADRTKKWQPVTLNLRGGTAEVYPMRRLPRLPHGSSSSNMASSSSTVNSGQSLPRGVFRYPRVRGKAVESRAYDFIRQHNRSSATKRLPFTPGSVREIDLEFNESEESYL